MFTFPNKVICVTCRSLCRRPLEEQVGRIAAVGVKQVILREKDLSEEEYMRLADAVLKQCEKYGADLIIHSFPDAARKLGVKKLHMPLNMLTADLCGEFETVGSSVHSVEDAVSAEKMGVSYVTAGHIFATDCKKGLPPRGLDLLRQVCGAVDIPVYAIGGINEENIGQVLDAGAQGACIMSGLMRI